MSDEQEDYAVGYGRPPVGSRFAAGVSGNPNGRPKGARSLANEVGDLLSARIYVIRDGRRQRAPRRRIIAEKLVGRAMRDDHKALETVIRIDGAAQIQSGGTVGGGTGPVTRETSLAEDEAILAAFVARSQEMP